MDHHADKLRLARQKLSEKTAKSVALKSLRSIIFPIHTLVFLISEAAGEFGRKKAFIHGAALSYYTVFSLPPMLLITIMTVGYFLGEDAVKDQLLVTVEEHVGAEAQQQIKMVLDNITPHSQGFVATIVGFATLFFSSTIIFYTLKNSLNDFWNVHPVKGQGIILVIFGRITAFLMVIIAGGILFLAVIVETILVAINHYFEEFMNGMMAELIFYSHSSISFIVMVLLFALIYKYLPDAKIAWKDVMVGSLVTSLLFTAGQIGIAWYLGQSNMADSYGAAGSVIIILSWVFYSSQILYFGAEFTYVYAQAIGNGVEQSRLAKRLNRLI